MKWRRMPDDVLTRAARMHDNSATLLGGLPTCCPTATGSRFRRSGRLQRLSGMTAWIKFSAHLNAQVLLIVIIP